MINFPFKKFISIFLQHEIDPNSFIRLKDEHLQAMGISKITPRHTILQKIQEYIKEKRSKSGEAGNQCENGTLEISGKEKIERMQEIDNPELENITPASEEELGDQEDSTNNPREEEENENQGLGPERMQSICDTTEFTQDNIFENGILDQHLGIFGLCNTINFDDEPPEILAQSNSQTPPSSPLPAISSLEDISLPPDILFQ